MLQQFKWKGFLVGIIVVVMIAMAGCMKDEPQRDLTGPADSSADLSQSVEGYYYSTSSDSSESSGTTPPTNAPEGALVFESLQDGQTVGTFVNAHFTSEGLFLENGDGYIEYSVPTIPNGYVEFSAKGFVQNELHGGSEFKSALFTMWDGNAPYYYEQASYFYELRKFGHIDGRPDASNALDLRVSSRASSGEWHHGQRVVVGWNPAQTYRFRIEWGYGSTTVYRDGVQITSATVSPEFSPGNHMIGIGANLRSVVSTRRRESPHNIVISNVVIGTR